MNCFFPFFLGVYCFLCEKRDPEIGRPPIPRMIWISLSSSTESFIDHRSYRHWLTRTSISSVKNHHRTQQAVVALVGNLAVLLQFVERVSQALNMVSSSQEADAPRSPSMDLASDDDADFPATQFVPKTKHHDSQSSEELWAVRGILDESGGRGAEGKYLIDWEGDDPETGRPYKPTWEVKTNATNATIQEWKEKLMKDPTLKGRYNSKGALTAQWKKILAKRQIERGKKKMKEETADVDEEEDFEPAGGSRPVRSRSTSTPRTRQYSSPAAAPKSPMTRSSSDNGNNNKRRRQTAHEDDSEEASGDGDEAERDNSKRKKSTSTRSGSAGSSSGNKRQKRKASNGDDDGEVPLIAPLPPARPIHPMFRKRGAREPSTETDQAKDTEQAKTKDTPPTRSSPRAGPSKVTQKKPADRDVIPETDSAEEEEEEAIPDEDEVPPTSLPAKKAKTRQTKKRVQESKLDTEPEEGVEEIDELDSPQPNQSTSHKKDGKTVTFRSPTTQDKRSPSQYASSSQASDRQQAGPGASEDAPQEKQVEDQEHSEEEELQEQSQGGVYWPESQRQDLDEVLDMIMDDVGCVVEEDKEEQQPQPEAGPSNTTATQAQDEAVQPPPTQVNEAVAEPPQQEVAQVDGEQIVTVTTETEVQIAQPAEVSAAAEAPAATLNVVRDDVFLVDAISPEKAAGPAQSLIGRELGAVPFMSPSTFRNLQRDDAPDPTQTESIDDFSSSPTRPTEDDEDNNRQTWTGPMADINGTHAPKEPRDASIASASDDEDMEPHTQAPLESQPVPLTQTMPDSQNEPQMQVPLEILPVVSESQNDPQTQVPSTSQSLPSTQAPPAGQTEPHLTNSSGGSDLNLTQFAPHAQTQPLNASDPAASASQPASSSESSSAAEIAELRELIRVRDATITELQASLAAAASDAKDKDAEIARLQEKIDELEQSNQNQAQHTQFLQAQYAESSDRAVQHAQRANQLEQAKKTLQTQLHIGLMQRDNHATAMEKAKNAEIDELRSRLQFFEDRSKLASETKVVRDAARFWQTKTRLSHKDFEIEELRGEVEYWRGKHKRVSKAMRRDSQIQLHRSNPDVDDSDVDTSSVASAMSTDNDDESNEQILQKLEGNSDVAMAEELQLLLEEQHEAARALAAAAAAPVDSLGAASSSGKHQDSQQEASPSKCIVPGFTPGTVDLQPYDPANLDPDDELVICNWVPEGQEVPCQAAFQSHEVSKASNSVRGLEADAQIGSSLPPTSTSIMPRRKRETSDDDCCSLAKSFSIRLFLHFDSCDFAVLMTKIPSLRVGAP